MNEKLRDLINLRVGSPIDRANEVTTKFPELRELPANSISLFCLYYLHSIFGQSPMISRQLKDIGVFLEMGYYANALEDLLGVPAEEIDSKWSLASVLEKLVSSDLLATNPSLSKNS